MVSHERQASQVASTLAWLEDNVRETKAQIARLSQVAEEAQNQAWDLAHRVIQAEEVAASLATQLGMVPRIEGQVSSLSDRLVRVDDRQALVEAKLIEIGRQQQHDADYLRVELNEAVKRVDAGERLMQSWTVRLDTIEEIGRRSQDAASVVRQRIEEFERFVDLVDQRVSRTSDALKRIDNEFTRINTEIEALQTQDALTGDRIQVYAEYIKRLDEQVAIVGQQVDMRHEVTEKLELHRAGIRRGEERLGTLEASDEQTRQQVDDLQRATALIESKDKALRDRLTELQEQLGQYNAHISDQFQRTHVLFEKQKRRLIENTERDIRELKVNVYRPNEE